MNNRQRRESKGRNLPSMTELDRRLTQEPVEVDDWVAGALSRLEDTEKIVQLAEDLFCVGILSQDHLLAETVLIELDAVEIGPTDEQMRCGQSSCGQPSTRDSTVGTLMVLLG